jgi:polyphosphate kinase
VAFPVYAEPLKRQIIDILKIQLEDNRSAVWVDEHLNNIFKRDTASPDEPPVRAQQAIHSYLKQSTGQ